MATMKLTAKTIQPYLDNIREWGLVVPEWFWGLSAEEIASAYNGVGSELTWKWLRKILSFIFRWALCAVIIHDTIWQYKDKYKLTIEDFYISNENLKINARKQLKQNTPWYHPLYAYRYYNAWRAGRACNIFGKEAWNK